MKTAKVRKSSNIKAFGLFLCEALVSGSPPGTVDSRRLYGIFYGINSLAGGGTVMALKDLEIKNLKPSVKPRKLYDGGGLFLFLAPSGLKSWRYEYAFQGRRSTLTFGTYPDLSLKDARERLADAKRLLREGADSGIRGKAAQQTEEAVAPETFRTVALEWFERKKPGK
ncbi:MAG: Arm DNA-binding domain-containing protein [Deltaproteobacteria bacterium]|jgi:hypothetical protein|nr:Arm DNA-binding domain-containing protein [Deltaproteobacteria bacterium]